MVDSSLGVSKNLIIGGKSYFEQEMYLHHITAPRETQATYQSIVYARPCLGGAGALGTFKATISGPADIHGALLSDREHTITFSSCEDSTENSIICTPHGHNFDNIPLTLKDSNAEVREAAKEANIDHRYDK